jgi:hypothetical protein
MYLALPVSGAVVGVLHTAVIGSWAAGYGTSGTEKSGPTRPHARRAYPFVF